MWGCGGQPRTLLGDALGAIVGRRGGGWGGDLEPTGGGLFKKFLGLRRSRPAAGLTWRAPRNRLIADLRVPSASFATGTRLALPAMAPPSQPPAVTAGRSHRGGCAAAAAEGQVRQQGMCRRMRRARAPLGQQAALRVPAGFSFVFPCSGCQSRQASLQRAPQWSHQACGDSIHAGAGLRWPARGGPQAVRPPRRRAPPCRRVAFLSASKRLHGTSKSSRRAWAELQVVVDARHVLALGVWLHGRRQQLRDLAIHMDKSNAAAAEQPALLVSGLNSHSLRRLVLRLQAPETPPPPGSDSIPLGGWLAEALPGLEELAVHGSRFTARGAWPPASRS